MLKMETDFFGCKLPKVSGPWFPYLESDGGWIRLATLGFVRSLRVRKFSHGLPVICSVLGIFFVCFVLNVEKDFASQVGVVGNPSMPQSPVPSGGHTEMRITESLSCMRRQVHWCL